MLIEQVDGRSGGVQARDAARMKALNKMKLFNSLANHIGIDPTVF